MLGCMDSFVFAMGGGEAIQITNTLSRVVISVELNLVSCRFKRKTDSRRRLPKREREKRTKWPQERGKKSEIWTVRRRGVRHRVVRRGVVQVQTNNNYDNNDNNKRIGQIGFSLSVSIEYHLRFCESQKGLVD